MAKISIAIIFIALCISCSKAKQDDAEIFRPLTAPEDPCEDERANDFYVVPYSDTLLVMLKGRDLWEAYDCYFRFCYDSYHHFRQTFLFEDNENLIESVLSKEIGGMSVSKKNKEMFSEFTQSRKAFLRKHLIAIPNYKLNNVLKYGPHEDLETLVYILNIMGYIVWQDDLSGYYRAKFDRTFQMLNSPSPYSIVLNQAASHFN